MKKSIVLLLASMFLLSCASVTYASDLDRFQPYTDVDLSVFDKAGWTCTVNEWEFSAEVDPVKQIADVESDSSLSDSYSTTMDLKIVYNAGACTVVPRLIFSRSGMMTYYDDKMTDVYIRTGENRYDIDTKGCSRSSSAKNSTATDTSVEVMYERGFTVLEDLAYSEHPIEIKMGSFPFGTSMELTSQDQEAIKEFYETCKEAGIFEQSFLSLFEDDYEVVTLFNEGSPDLEETVIDETEMELGDPGSDGEGLSDLFG